MTFSSYYFCSNVEGTRKILSGWKVHLSSTRLLVVASAGHGNWWWSGREWVSVSGGSPGYPLQLRLHAGLRQQATSPADPSDAVNIGGRKKRVCFSPKRIIHTPRRKGENKTQSLCDVTRYEARIFQRQGAKRHSSPPLYHLAGVRVYIVAISRFSFFSFIRNNSGLTYVQSLQTGWIIAYPCNETFYTINSRLNMFCIRAGFSPPLSPPSPPSPISVAAARAPSPR